MNPLFILIIIIAGVIRLIRSLLKNQQFPKLDSIWAFFLSIIILLITTSGIHLSIITNTTLSDHIIGGLNIAAILFILYFTTMNLRYTAIAIFGIGVLLNTIALMIHGGHMPITRDGYFFLYEMNNTTTIPYRIHILSDEHNAILHNAILLLVPNVSGIVFSVGDIFMLLGATFFALCAGVFAKD